MTLTSIEDQAAEVASKADFVRLIGALAVDLDQHPENWENRSLPDFLRALEGWAQDCGGYYRDQGEKMSPDHPQWRVFAEMLLAARVYE